MRRYETRSTMMTSNRPLEDWGKLIGDVPAATAILDRFLHHAEIIQITGKSYRLKGQARSEEGAPSGCTNGAPVENGPPEEGTLTAQNRPPEEEAPPGKKAGKK